MNYKIINKRKFMKELDVILNNCPAFNDYSQTVKLSLRASIRRRLVK